MVEDAVDLDRYPLKGPEESAGDGRLVIGWVGNAMAGLRYLEPLREPLVKLFDRHANLVFQIVNIARV